MAGKYKLDDAKKREIVAILSVGGTRLTAADYVGCTVPTVVRTAERDPEFADALRQAECRHEIVNLQNIQDAGKKSWRASSWLLERSFPERYAKRPPRTMTVEELGYVVTQFARIVAMEVSSLADRDKVLRKLDSLAARLCRAAPAAPRQRKPAAAAHKKST